MFPTLGELAGIVGRWDHQNNDREAKLISDACYVGWAYSASQTQRGLTEAGAAALKRFQGKQAPEAVTV